LPELAAERGPCAAPGEVVEPLDAIDVDDVEIHLGRLSPGPGRPPAAVARHQRARIHRATIDLVAEQGHDEVGMRAITRRAGVSTKTFYQQYSSKKECLLRIQGLVAQRALSSLVAAQAGLESREERIRKGVAALLNEWGGDAGATYLMLFAAESADVEIRSHAQKAMRAIELGFANGINSGTKGAAEPSGLINRGIFYGLAGIARQRLLEGSCSSLAELSDELGEWAVTLRVDDSSLQRLERLVELHRHERFGACSHVDPLSKLEADGRKGAVVAGDRRALLLAAMSKLTVSRQADGLTPGDVFSLAGLRKGDFFAHFSSVKECLGAATEFRLGGAMAAAARSGEAEEREPLRAYRVIVDLIGRIVADRPLAGLCLEDGGVMAPSDLRAPEWRIDALRKALGLAGCSVASAGDDVTLDASLGAMWSALRHQLAAERGAGPNVFAPVLGYLVLAPVWGAEAVIEAMISSQSANARATALATAT
jgi:AcrR family transcriptional regulator